VRVNANNYAASKECTYFTGQQSSGNRNGDSLRSIEKFAHAPNSIRFLSVSSRDTSAKKE